MNIALPRVQDALEFSTTDLTWVVSAYPLTVADLLLLGARAGGILGRRRVLMTGILLFTLSAGGGAIGLPAGGMLADWLDRRWVFFVDVPIGPLVVALTSHCVNQPRARAARGAHPTCTIATSPSDSASLTAVRTRAECGADAGKTPRGHAEFPSGTESLESARGAAPPGQGGP